MKRDKLKREKTCKSREREREKTCKSRERERERERERNIVERDEKKRLSRQQHVHVCTLHLT